MEKGEYLMFYHDEMYEPLTDFIDSLRAVARAAQFICPPKPHSDFDTQGFFTLREALDALPKWILEE